MQVSLIHAFPWFLHANALWWSWWWWCYIILIHMVHMMTLMMNWQVHILNIQNNMWCSLCSCRIAFPGLKKRSFSGHEPESTKFVFGFELHRPFSKSLQLTVWVFSLIFWHDLSVINMHQNKLISPFPTPFGHLHFHSTHILTLAETCLLRHIKPRIDVENFGVVV